MAIFTKLGRLAVRRRLTLIATSAIAAAVGLASATSIFTFPLLADVSSDSVSWAVAATAFLVAFPVVAALTTVIGLVEVQRRDLAAREDLFRTAQRIGKLGYWYYEVASGKVILSDSVHDMLADPERKLRMTLPKLLEITNPVERIRMRSSLERIIMNGGSAQSEYRITGLDGVEKTIWVDGGRRLLDAKGNPVRAYGACQDVTDRKTIEDALRESEDHYRHAVELNPQIPWTADPDGNILELGPRWLELMGVEREAALGNGWAAALHPEDVERTFQLWSGALASGKPFDIEYRLRQCDGSYRWFRARAAARRNEQGETVRWYGTLEDVHDRKISDAALQDSEAFARSILDSTPDCVRVVDLSGKVQFINNPGLRNLELDNFTEGRDWASFWPEEARGRVSEALATAREGSIVYFSGFCPTAKGTPKWWDVSVSPINGPDGNPDRLLITSRDMSAVMHSQDELKLARQKAEDTARRLENVLSSTTDNVITLDQDLRFTYLNRQAQQLIADGRNLFGMNHREAFPELADSGIEEHYREALIRQVPVHFESFLSKYNMWLEVHAYPSSEGVSVFFKDISKQHRSQEQLFYLAHHDSLTGLLNRAVLHEQLARAVAGSSGNKQAALLFLDLDEFKSVNDFLGHSVGDRVLAEVAERLKNCAEEEDTVARFGGDEFAIVRADKTDLTDITEFSDRIIVSLSRPYDVDGRPVTIGVSIGIVLVSGPGVETDEVVRDADIALYQAKSEGRGRFRIYKPAMRHRFEEQQELKQELRGALARGELSIEYQPLVDFRTSRISGFEALLRWYHPARGSIPPSAFIPIAEETGAIVQIGEWVLSEACREAASWPSEISVAVNLSPVQFRGGVLPSWVSRCLAESGLSAQRLQLEITETVLLVDNEFNLRVLHDLRRMGVSISMDDFGTGYSSLFYLRSYPFNKIKIDRAFVSDLTGGGGSSRGCNTIVRAVVELARSLGIATTAEGIETESQFKALCAMGCSEGQGYLFSRPLPAQRAAEMARSGLWEIEATSSPAEKLAVPSRRRLIESAAQ